MKTVKGVVSVFIILFFISCRFQGDSDRRYAEYKDKLFHLKLNPPNGSIYHYDFESEQKIELEVDGKEITNTTKTSSSAKYHVSTDSAGNIVLKTIYEGIHMNIRNGDEESDMDAKNASFSTNPVERFLGLLKDAEIIALVKPSGEIVRIKGVKEIGDKLIAQFDPNDISGKKAAEDQWNKIVGDKLVRNNLTQLFEIFPDSAVYVGQKWRLDRNESNELDLKVRNFFHLKDVTPDYSILESEGTIKTENGTRSYNGYQVIASLEGDQKGEYEMETKTGIVRKLKSITTIEGEMEMAGKKIPMKIKTVLTVGGKRLK